MYKIIMVHKALHFLYVDICSLLSIFSLGLEEFPELVSELERGVCVGGSDNYIMTGRERRGF